ncbi:hypothetical protein [Dyella agri]|uniref:hypothetical protein n=1 Tax=Dyella agri TaxID=1926869 RepID=UPI00384F9CB3
MDSSKCSLLKSKLASCPEPQFVSIDEFFDGNDDEGSIGCNLWPNHPGIAAFRETLATLAARHDVDQVVIEINEADPGADDWPFSDVVYVAGAVPELTLQSLLSPLAPDEVAEMPAHDAPPYLQRISSPIFRVWWD